jgi:hypothetical protein
MEFLKNVTTVISTAFSSKTEVERRLNICSACEKYKNNVCLECKCYMPFKAKLEHVKCPKNNW